MDLGADFAIHQSSDGLPLIVEAFLSQRITKIDISRFVVKKQDQFGMAAPGAVPTPASDTAESARLKNRLSNNTGRCLRYVTHSQISEIRHTRLERRERSNGKTYTVAKQSDTLLAM